MPDALMPPLSMLAGIQLAFSEVPWMPAKSMLA